MEDELAFLPATELAALVRSRQVSPVELVDLYLDRIERIDPGLGSYLTVAADHARAEAKRAEGLAGEDAPPLCGVPVGLKDVVDTAGIRTTFATGAWSDRIPETDAAVVAKLRAAGCIVLGKHSMPEFSGGTYTEPAAYGPCRNPWNTAFSPGGSSGGSGAAVAAGLCAAALGSDDGGSIRIPSGWNGLVGIKPSRGRVSAAPEPQALEFTCGPMARTVGDAAALLDAMSGYVTGDAFWAPPPARPFAREVGVDPGRLRIAFTSQGADGVETRAAEREAVASTARVLAGLGHDLVEVSEWPGRGLFPDDRALPLHVVYGVRFAALIDAGRMPPAESLEPTNQMLVALGRQAKATELYHAAYLAACSSREVVAFFDGYDAFLTPVTAWGPSRVGELASDPGKALDLLRAIQFTAQFSVSGQPAVAVPAGMDPDGVPVGVQLVGRPADECTLLRLAAQLEAEQPWRDRRPAI